MAGNTAQIANEIAGRCRRIGWRVESPNGASGWLYKIYAPGRALPVVIHQTPSTVRWRANTMTQLNRLGFAEAEREMNVTETRARQAKLAADREANDVKTAKVTAKAAKHAAALTRAAGQLLPKRVDMDWLTTPRGENAMAETRTVIIMPADAKEILERFNPLNRKESASRVAYFINCIKDKEFGCTHQGGAFDWFGRLQDGQSRLRAIEVTGEGQTMQWTVGSDPQNFYRVDTGMNRSARDAAYIKMRELGLHNDDGIDHTSDAGTIAATAKMLIVIDNHGPVAHVRSRSGRISNDRIEHALTEYGDHLLAAVARARIIKKSVRKLNPSALSTAIYLVTMRLPENDPRVEQFFDDLESGAGMDRDDPVSLLHKRLRNDDFPRTAWEQCALLLTAWNKRAKGERGKTSIVWKVNQDFPANVFLPPPIDIDPAFKNGKAVAA